ncbi:PAC2 family protein [Agromyces cerinus]|uniref:PAC2 family protein n=1 Tax=Agromyces cerinus subsp. cerinus TaxID=232089 RepID=A0A1N6DZ06_9MICO|nr:PAC2 family protein [Agromyces cerinus]SIN75937.1 PAC2 family protein [Agromyces cerinus subsp. cerinus]
MNQPAGFEGGRLLVVAFEGWNDAGEAATGAAKLLVERLGLVEIAAVDPELYFDYQFTRPTIVLGDDGTRRLEWPGAAVMGPGGLPASDEDDDRVTGPGAETLHVLLGAEPARSWKGFAAELVDAALAADIEGIVLLGAMLADAPHTRPLSVFASSENPEVRSALGVERSTYEGPVGILSVIADQAERAGIPTVSLWASVPHYVHNAPSPKAVLALLGKVEELTGLSIPRGSLEVDAKAWEAGVDALAAEDDEMAGYITQLEQARDAVDAPEASGEAIAQEFERYLRRRGEEPGGRADGRGEGPR